MNGIDLGAILPVVEKILRCLLTIIGQSFQVAGQVITQEFPAFAEKIGSIFSWIVALIH